MAEIDPVRVASDLPQGPLQCIGALREGEEEEKERNQEEVVEERDAGREPLPPRKPAYDLPLDDRHSAENGGKRKPKARSDRQKSLEAGRMRPGDDPDNKPDRVSSQGRVEESA